MGPREVEGASHAMSKIDQFKHWARPYYSHQSECLEGCSPTLPNCDTGWSVARQCIKAGPVARFEDHEMICIECRSSRHCEIGKSHQAELEEFIQFLHVKGIDSSAA